jgi:hypothetical protein
MRPDILDKINSDFENLEEVISILKVMESTNPEPVSDRIYRSIIFLSEGNINKLNHFIELFFTDYRDLIWQAEYEDPEIQKYDFNKSFKELGLYQGIK